MNTRSMITATAALAALEPYAPPTSYAITAGPRSAARPSPRRRPLWSRRREKYAGQSTRYRVGSWKGDGTVPAPTRQMRRRAERDAAKSARRKRNGLAS